MRIAIEGQRFFHEVIDVFKEKNHRIMLSILHSFTSYTTAHALIYDTSIFLRLVLGGGGEGIPGHPPSI